MRDGLLQLSKDLAIPVIATNDSHYVNREDAPGPRAPALRLLRLGDERPEAVQARRRRLLHQVRGRDARAVGAQARHEGGLRQHPPDRRALRGRLHRGQRHLHAPLPGPRRRHRGGVVPPRGRAGPRASLPGRHQPGGARARRLRDGRHPPDGLPGLLPGRRRLHQLGQGQRHPGRSGPRLGGRVDVRLRPAHHRPRPPRARPAVRALPQPRARLDARLRHRLRRAPAQRGDPLRQREVRRGPGLDDRHLRHDQGQAGGQGLQPDPRLPLRDGRPDHQGDAGRGDGQGHPAQGDLRPRAQAVRRGRRVPLALRGRPRRQDRRRHRDRPRGPQAAVGRPRRRRDHVERAAARHHPADPPAPGRRDHHPVRLPDVRAPRADQDGLPGAAQPHRPRRHASRTSSATAARPWSWRTSPSTTPRRTPSCSAATPSASSSWTAARCARCSARCGPTSSPTSARSARSTGPARWAWTPTTSTPAARPVASRSSRSTPSSPSRWPRSSTRPTA